MTGDQLWAWVELNGADLCPVYDENERKTGYVCRTPLTTWIQGGDARQAVEKCRKLLEGEMK